MNNFHSKNFGQAEKCFIDAEAPQKAIDMYLSLGMQGEALRVHNQYF